MKHISPVPSNYRGMRITGNSRYQEGGGALGIGVGAVHAGLALHALPLRGHRGELWVRGGKQSWREQALGSKDWGGEGLTKKTRDPVSKGS